MSTLRPLGVGSQILIHGDRMAGFYGEVNEIITADELRNISGVSQGTPMQTGDIAWLKFSHNYKTLYVAKEPIQHSISWDYLQEKDLVFGKMIEIGNKVYLLRLLQGSNINPTTTNDVDIMLSNSEFGTLVVGFKDYTGISDIIGYNWVQEVVTYNSNNRLVRDVGVATHSPSGRIQYNIRWLPVLELLY